MKPDIDVYDQEFVELYDKAFERVYDEKYIMNRNIYSPLWLCYTDKKPYGALDAFYDAPDSIQPVAWIEYLAFHKTGKRKRLKETFPRISHYVNECTPASEEELFIHAVNHLHASALATLIADSRSEMAHRVEYYRIKGRIHTIPDNCKAWAMIAELYRPGADVVPDESNRFVAVKALEKYGKHWEARGLAIRSAYDDLDSGEVDPLFAISCMIENVLGVQVSLPMKSLEWLIPDWESTGIWGLKLGKATYSLHTRERFGKRMVSVNADCLTRFTFEVDGFERRTIPVEHAACSVYLERAHGD